MLHWKTTTAGLAIGLPLAGKALETYNSGDVLGAILLGISALGAILLGSAAADGKNVLQLNPTLPATEK